MRRYLKPFLTIVAAGAAALVVITSGSAFDGAPAAKTKTIECRETQVGATKVKPKTFLPSLPTIPKAQLPCDKLTQTPPGLQNLPSKLYEVQDRIVNVLNPTTTTTAPPTPCQAGDPPSTCTNSADCLNAGYAWFIDGDSGTCQAEI